MLLNLSKSFIKPVRNIHPKIPSTCFVAPFAVICGDVVMGENCSIWFHAVLRGDVNSIRIGNDVNVQDGACIHCTFEKTTTTIGNKVSIGHRAIIHGCTLHENVLIGMGAIIMDNAVVHSNTIIAAGAVVTEGMICESNSVYAGVPAKRIKSINKELSQGEIQRIAENYKKYSKWYTEQDETK